MMAVGSKRTSSLNRRWEACQTKDAQIRKPGLTLSENAESVESVAVDCSAGDAMGDDIGRTLMTRKRGDKGTAVVATERKYVVKTIREVLETAEGDRVQSGCTVTLEMEGRMQQAKAFGMVDNASA